MNNKKVAFYTLGCKVNQYETNAMKQQLMEAEYKIVDFEEIADIYIINTCTVTNISDRKSRQMLRRVKNINPNAILIVVGCYVQVAKKELENIQQIDMVLGNNEKKDILKYIKEFENQRPKEEVSDVMHQKEYVEFGDVTHTDKIRAVVKVQDGCDRFCSYCIIPYARGRVRSRKVEHIVSEIEQMAKKGIKEVVITGIHIASYGKDFKEKIGLIDLIERVEQIQGIERIRLGSIEPTLIDKDFVKRLKSLNKVCHHFHLSLQSGCDDTLKRMNRKYTTQQFYRAVALLRENFEDVILTADVIVGFPGETEEEFSKTYEFLKQIHFYKIHVFKYSQRKGTKAASMENQIDGNIKDERSKKIIELSNQSQNKYHSKYQDKIVEVLFEEREKQFQKGHTANYIMVNVEGLEELTNQIRKVKITKVDSNGLIGMLLK